jgi:hypothetical protein
MSVSDALVVGFDGYQELLTAMTADTVVCVRGRHAIGKSEGVYQAAAKRRSNLYKDPEYCAAMVDALKDPTHGGIRHATGWVTKWTYDMGLPVVERRLSQMTEGDMIGLPFKSMVAGQECTQFLACDWIIQSCHFPVMLFLDERNRALDGVKQAVFQLADSKAFYGNRIHPETCIVVAENVGDAYQVQQNDPAEVSRYVTVTLDPSKEEFFAYAENKLHDAILEFLRGSPNLLEVKSGVVVEPNKKTPDRRSWMKFNTVCLETGILDQDEPPKLLRILAGGHLGVETGATFYKFCQERERQVKAEDVLTDWKKVRRRLSKRAPMSAEKYVEIVHKLGDWLKTKNDAGDEKDPNDPKSSGRKLTESQADQLAAFMNDCPAEPRMACWSILQKDSQNLFMVHPRIEKLMVSTATGEDMQNLTSDQDDDDNNSSSAPRQRGRKLR